MSYFFVPDRKSFYYRSYVPKELRDLLNGRREVWRSLFCTDKDEARLRAADWDIRTQQVYMTLRKQGGRMSDAQRDALVAEWLEAELEYAEDCRVTAGRMSESMVEAQLEGLSIMQDEALEDMQANDYRRVESIAEELLKTAGLPIDRERPDFWRLCRKLLMAKYKYTRIEDRRWQGEEYTPLIQRPTLNGHTQPTPPLSTPTPASASALTPEGAATGPLFLEAVEGYLREHPRTERSTRALKAELRRFVTVIGGDRAVSTITKSDCLKYKDSLLKADQRSLHLNTVHNLLTTLGSIFRWCEGQGYIPEHSNPVRNLQPSAKAVRKAKQSRKLFTDAQLVMIFGSEKFKSLRTKHPAHYWVLLICLFGVCRPEEAAQLHMSDIREEDGIPYLLITEEEGTDKSVKTKTTRRLPVHESLIQLGFLDYVKLVRAAGHKRLFYQVTKGRSTYADAAGKVFSRLVRGLGMTDKGLVRYSLRHGGSTKLLEAGCPPDIARILTGHAGQDVHDKVYVHREKVKLSVLRDWMNRLRYDEVVSVLMDKGR